MNEQTENSIETLWESLPIGFVVQRPKPRE